MLIDQFLPRYDVSARYQVDIHAPIQRAYSVARFLDMSDSRIVRWLYRLRGLPEYGLTLDGMLKCGFILLADKLPQEFVFGLIGRFWTPAAQIQPINADAFVKFDRPGFAKRWGTWRSFPMAMEAFELQLQQRRGFTAWIVQAGSVFVCIGCLLVHSAA